MKIFKKKLEKEMDLPVGAVILKYGISEHSVHVWYLEREGAERCKKFFEICMTGDHLDDSDIDHGRLQHRETIINESSNWVVHIFERMT
jgi:hypothetical protein